jgi:hypothetical protein
MNENNRFFTAQQGRDAGLEVVERVAVLGEQNELLVRRRPGRGNLLSALGDGRCRAADLAAGDGENLAEKARQLTPLRIHTTVAHLQCELFETPQRLDFDL